MHQLRLRTLPHRKPFEAGSSHGFGVEHRSADDHAMTATVQFAAERAKQLEVTARTKGENENPHGRYNDETVLQRERQPTQ